MESRCLLPAMHFGCILLRGLTTSEVCKPLFLVDFIRICLYPQKATERTQQTWVIACARDPSRCYKKKKYIPATAILI